MGGASLNYLLRHPIESFFGKLSFLLKNFYFQPGIFDPIIPKTNY